jgi:adenosylcobinamide kinase/adenosylcobinamide-phosphate guanylyltransferase
MITLIIGGARSGKSTYAEKYCLGKSANPAYIATAQIYDSEMADRVKKHRDRRMGVWSNYEEPYNISLLIEKIINSHDVILLDCLTIYITNLMLKDYDYDEKNQELVMEEKERLIYEEVGKILKIIPQNKELVIVSNEVGLGIVPDNFLARAFRDISGRMNQFIGEECDQVILTTAGIPIKIKPDLERL